MKLTLITIAFAGLSIFYFSCEKTTDTDSDIHAGAIDNFPSEVNMEAITVSNVPELMATARLTVEGNKVVIIKDGIYELSSQLWLNGDNIIFRSESGNRDKVIIKGKGMKGSLDILFCIRGSNFSAKNLSLGSVSHHGILVQGEKNTNNLHLQNIRFFNIGRQMLKVSYNENEPDMFANNGTIENCLFENTIQTSSSPDGNAIDIVCNSGWNIRYNTFKNIMHPEDEMPAVAIRLLAKKGDCTIENNTIINCGSGIIIGSTEKSIGSISINKNMLTVNRGAGIAVYNQKIVEVIGNTVYSSSDYPCAIEYNTLDASLVENNLTNKPILLGNGKRNLSDSNITNAREEWFKNVKKGNLNLTRKIHEPENVQNQLAEIAANLN